MPEQQIISAVASSSNSSSTVSPKKYDVFLSFRGEDTRMNFTSHLHEALKQKKVETYIDYRLEKGDEISPALIKAIKDSHISVVILSENYASSKWCLEELSKILECRKNQGQIVKPIFYNIDPSHVRKQTGSYKKAFAKHEGEPRCKKWNAALTEVANLAGWDSRNRTESELLKDIVGDILRKLTPSCRNQLKGFVGIEEKLGQIESHLKIWSGGVKTIGIWGMGGIGKTTLAKALYAKLSPEFEVSCFLANVRENSEKLGLEALRSKLFSQLLETENHCFDAPFLVSNFVKRRLGQKKVLIVLDDVTTLKKLEHLIEDFDLFGPGSRVVVTTRNKKIFRQVDEVLEIKRLSYDHSLELFCLIAFEEKQPKQGFEHLSRSAISYCCGIPLALKVLGASLRRRSKEAWESELRKLENIPNTEIHEILKLSYDGLDDSQQDVFLDIACFFKGERRDRVTFLLEACGFFPASEIEVLLDKALITISNWDCIEMHDMIQQMGREIVRQESIKDPGKRTRLWKHEEVHEVLKYSTGTDVVEGIALYLCELTEDLYLKSNSFTKMTKMRFLKIHGYSETNRFSVHFPCGLESLSDKLRYLHWDGFCLESLPSNFCAAQLVELRMRYSKVKKLWDGVQNLVNLKKIDLSWSGELIEIPDLSKAEKLESVYLSHCENLRQLHPSMSSQPKLTYFDACDCRAIESLNVCGCCNTSDKLSDDLGMGSIPTLDYYGGTQRNAWKQSSIQAHNIGHFNGTNVESLPANIKFLPLLKRLYLAYCIKLMSLPELPPSLQYLSLRDCRKLVSLPKLPLSLQYLWLRDCRKLVSLPELPPYLQYLSLWDCRKLVSLPELPLSLRDLSLQDCRKLVSLPELPQSLEELRTSNCNSLDTDFTQRLLLQHMLQSSIPLSHQRSNYDYFMFPGEHVTDKCGFRTTGRSITIPSLPLSHLHAFIYCIIISTGSYNGVVDWFIYQHGKEVDRGYKYLVYTNLISDHVLLFYVTRPDVFYDIQKKRSHVCSNDLPFQFEFAIRNSAKNEVYIKECGIFPVYASKSGLKLFGSSSKKSFESESISQMSDNESQHTGIGVGDSVGGSNSQNETKWDQLLYVITSSVFF